MEIETHELKTTESARVLLASLAHPDDESFGMGGTLARYAAEGVAVHLICATKGEAGSFDEEHLTKYGSAEAVRTAELACAAQELGLTSVNYLCYRDSGMSGSPDNAHARALAAADLEEVAAKVTHVIRQRKPQVVVTFDPIGGYRHPDHIAIHKATVMAFHAAGDAAQYPNELPPFQPQKLYYLTFPRKLARWIMRLRALVGKKSQTFGRNNDIDLTDILNTDYPLHAYIDVTSAAEAKRSASDCHASQLQPPQGGLIGLVFRRAFRKETFMRAYPAPSNGLRETDLFAGVS